MDSIYREWVKSLRQFLRSTNRIADHHIEEIEDGLLWTVLLVFIFIIGGGLLLYLEIISPPVPRMYIWGVIVLGILFAWRQLLVTLALEIYCAWLERRDQRSEEAKERRLRRK